MQSHTWRSLKNKTSKTWKNPAMHVVATLYSDEIPTLMTLGLSEVCTIFLLLLCWRCTTLLGKLKLSSSMTRSRPETVIFFIFSLGLFSVSYDMNWKTFLVVMIPSLTRKAVIQAPIFSEENDRSQVWVRIPLRWREHKRLPIRQMWQPPSKR